MTQAAQPVKIVDMDDIGTVAVPVVQAHDVSNIDDLVEMETAAPIVVAAAVADAAVEAVEEKAETPLDSQFETDIDIEALEAVEPVTPASGVVLMDMDDAGSTVVANPLPVQDFIDPDKLEEAPIDLPPSANADVPVAVSDVETPSPTPVPETPGSTFVADDDFKKSINELADDKTPTEEPHAVDPDKNTSSVDADKDKDDELVSPPGSGPVLGSRVGFVSNKPPQPSSPNPQSPQSAPSTGNTASVAQPGTPYEEDGPKGQSPAPGQAVSPGATSQQEAPRGARGGGGGGVGAGGALGILAGGIVAGTSALARGGSSLVSGTKSVLTAPVSKLVGSTQARVQNRNQEAAGLRQFKQAGEFMANCDTERENINTSIQSINTRIEAMPFGQVYLKGLSDYSNNVANTDGTSRGAAREKAVARIHDLSDTSDPVINGLRELATKISADPEVDLHTRAAKRGMSRMEREGAHAAECLKAGMENMQDGPEKRKLADAFEETAENLSTKDVTNAHLSKPGSEGKDRLEEASKTVKESMEALMDKIREMIRNLLSALGFGKRR